jgi:hypothetical protein
MASDVTVYKATWCKCCGAWVDHLEAEGFKVTVIERDDVTPDKERLGVPADLHSCHTGVIDGYVLEGHVPAAEVKRLLKDRPKAIGLAVPGMPIGSPGMEQGTERDAYDVVLFSATEQSVFTHYQAIEE